MRVCPIYEGTDPQESEILNQLFARWTLGFREVMHQIFYVPDKAALIIPKPERDFPITTLTVVLQLP
jgi:hypothetical protein